MDFLLEPLEPGMDIDKLLETAIQVECREGYACVPTGIVKVGEI